MEHKIDYFCEVERENRDERVKVLRILNQKSKKSKVESKRNSIKYMHVDIYIHIYVYVYVYVHLVHQLGMPMPC